MGLLFKESKNNHHYPKEEDSLLATNPIHNNPSPKLLPDGVNGSPQKRSLLIGKPVAWLRGKEERGYFMRVTTLAVAFFATIILWTSLIGIPLWLLAYNEFQRQNYELERLRDISLIQDHTKKSISGAASSEASNSTPEIATLQNKLADAEKKINDLDNALKKIKRASGMHDTNYEDIDVIVALIENMRRENEQADRVNEVQNK